MLTDLPAELLYSILDFLEFHDAVSLSFTHRSLQPAVRNFLRSNFAFHEAVYERMLDFERTATDNTDSIAYDLLQLICDIVEPMPNYEHRAIFSEKLDILQNLVVHRVLQIPNCEDHYARLCLRIRHIYLHAPSIRILHDPKYRRRSTKHPLAPFLPRDYTWIWRLHCEESRSLWGQNSVQPWYDTKLLEQRQKRLRFARFFGLLFAITSIYLEAHQHGTLDECIREALVAGDAESLYILATAAQREVDTEEMVMMVQQAGEQLWATLEMAAELEEHFHPDLVASRRQAGEGRADVAPDWLLPTRYQVDDNTIFRLKMMRNLHEIGWDWLSLCTLTPIET
ncbi:hypothetical protein BC943DRAFT_317584 [Umbelopsis sp. AD052]|nr:hypothetical protein BC943DRAFT_317584 [Umbelopsis sp. AD052]